MSGNNASGSWCGEVPLFEGLSAEQCAAVVRIADQHEFPAGETLVRQGGQVQRLWILLEGNCEVVKQVQVDGVASTIPLAQLSPYTTFGEMSFFHRASHSASVLALTPVKLLSIDRARFDELLKRDPITAFCLARNTVGHIAERLRHMDEWVAELLGRQVQPRIDELDHLRDKLFKQWAL